MFLLVKVHFNTLNTFGLLHCAKYFAKPLKPFINNNEKL